MVIAGKSVGPLLVVVVFFFFFIRGFRHTSSGLQNSLGKKFVSFNVPDRIIRSSYDGKILLLKLYFHVLSLLEHITSMCFLNVHQCISKCQLVLKCFPFLNLLQLFKDTVIVLWIFFSALSIQLWSLCFLLFFFFVFVCDALDVVFSFLHLFLLRQVSLCSPCQPRTCCVVQAGLELTEICQPLPPKCWD